MNDQAKQNRQRVAAFRQRKREAGFVAKERWAHPDDWPEIDKVIRRLNDRRGAK